MGNCAQSLCDKPKTMDVPVNTEDDKFKNQTTGNNNKIEEQIKLLRLKYPLLTNQKKMDKFVRLQNKIKTHLFVKKFKKVKANGFNKILSASKDVHMGSNRVKVDVNDVTDPRNMAKDNVRRRYKEVHIEPHKFYEGEWINGKRDGYGRLRWNDGSLYTGYFLNDKACGFGKLLHADGDIYLGYWDDDRAHGMGKYFNNRGASYEGFWALDKQNGYGNETWPKGSNFEGEYVDGAKHGFGVLLLEDNACYKGQFRDNDINGVGTFYFKDNRKYEGEWKYNKMYGYGILTWPDGKFFEGYFVNDKKEGFGVYYAISKVYIGMWKNSKLDGEVILVERGSIKKSLWSDGKKTQILPNDHKVSYENVVDSIMNYIKTIF
jgi:hypothetical protein